ncbi:hypothetical protein ACFCYC_15415 [Streptomyces sp. NPDC056402]|uniref:hypothetical protein n=1 Tax=Streptomyces sp. NPDC056402 TaxID=3345810 RepID=UPI0035D65DB5
MLKEAGRPGDIPSWVWESAETGDVVTMMEIIELLDETGKSDDASAWLRGLGERGDPMAMYVTARRLRKTGRTEEAEYWFQRALACLQNAESARTWERRWAERLPHDVDFGFTAPNMVVEILQEIGLDDEADAWIRDRAEAGDRAATKELAKRLRKAGNIPKALAWYQQAAEAGDHSVLTDIADVLGGMSRLEEAIAWHQRAAERQGHSLSTYCVISLLERAGRLEDVRRFKQYGLEPDGSLAAPWETMPPAL